LIACLTLGDNQILQGAFITETWTFNAIGTNLLNQFPSNRMELIPEVCERLDSQAFVNCKDRPENRPAKFHPAFDDPGAIVTYYPIAGCTSKCLRRV
jgi:hypothetical protein